MSTIKTDGTEDLTLDASGSGRDIKFQANGVEKASISSSGAFTSTTIDATKLTGALPAISGAALTGVGVAGITSTANGTAITINATENVGIEVTPESWENNYPALQIGGQGSLGGHSGSEVYVNENVYRNGGNWKHINTGAASQYTGTGGQHKFKIAPSASADAAISWTTAMTIDNDGIVTKPKQPAFMARMSNATGDFSTNTVHILAFSSESYDQNGDYNPSNYTFTAPVTGKYQLNTFFRLQQVDKDASYYHLYLQTSNRGYYDIIDARGFDTDLSYMNMRCSVLADMDAGDTANVKIYQSGGSSQTDVAANDDTHFSGYLVC